MTLREYWEELNQHDWYFEWSDDGSVWKRGSDDRKRLRQLSMLSNEHQDLYAGFHEHHFNGQVFGTPNVEKPEIPGEIACEEKKEF